MQVDFFSEIRGLLKLAEPHKRLQGWLTLFDKLGSENVTLTREQRSFLLTRLVDESESEVVRRGVECLLALTLNGSSEPIAADPARYAATMSFGFGLWMDYDWRRRGWNDADASSNYFQPEELYQSARAALGASDEFVWIYSEQPRWWSAEGRLKLPASYADALQRAKRHAGRARRPR